MDLWIRSQADYSDQKLIKVEQVQVELVIDDVWKVKANNIAVASYKSRERAIEVLDEIQSLLVDRFTIDPNYSFAGEALPRTCIVYQMPADPEK